MSSDLAVSLADAVGRLVRSLRQEAPGSEVGPGGLSVLVQLRSDGPQRLGALAEAIAVTAPSMTRIVSALEAEGLVSREADPDDGRAHRVVMTPAGRTLLASGEEAKLTALRRRLADLPADQRELIQAALPALTTLSSRPAARS